MASSLHADLSEFFDDLATDLTNLHVTAAAYQTAPTDQKAVDALAKVPAGLIDRAQALKARLDAEPSGEYQRKSVSASEFESAKPKPKAKPSTSKH